MEEGTEERAGFATHLQKYRFVLAAIEVVAIEKAGQLFYTQVGRLVGPGARVVEELRSPAALGREAGCELPRALLDEPAHRRPISWSFSQPFCSVRGPLH